MRKLASFTTTFEVLSSVSSVPLAKSPHSSQLAKIAETRALVNTSLLSLLTEIAKYCVDLLGPPPVQFAAVAMGSLGRGDAAPFSDVEYALIIADEKKLKDKYFSIFRELFEFTIDCIGERFGTHIDEQGTNNKSP